MKNKIQLIKQKHDWDCGVAATQTILNYFNIKPKNLIKKLKSNKQLGTNPENIIKVLNEYNLKVKEKKNCTLLYLRNIEHKNTLCLLSYYFYDYNVDHYAIYNRINNNFLFLYDPWYGSDHKININKFNYIWKFDIKHRPHKKWICLIQK